MGEVEIEERWMRSRSRGEVDEVEIEAKWVR